MSESCGVHGWRHDLREIGKKLEAAALPPTAEQTSIARFNALADQIRELREMLKNIMYDMDADFTELNAKLVLIKRAVAKKKAAPLVGKKGTGRKG